MANEQIATLNALGSAIQSEIDGKEFYLKMSRASGNAMGQKLFKALSDEEDDHRAKFEKIYKDIAAQKDWPDVKIERRIGDLKSIFIGATVHPKFGNDELDAVQKAMEMENRTRDFYLGRAEKAVFAVEKEFYEAVAKEERVHHSLLLDYFEYMQDPAHYFTLKEKHSLDGG